MRSFFLAPRAAPGTTALRFFSEALVGMWMAESPIFTMLPPTLEYQCVSAA